MNPNNLKRQASYTTLALVLIILSLLILGFSIAFFYSGNATIAESSQNLESAKERINILGTNSINDSDSLLGKGGAFDLSLSAKSRVDTIASLNQSNPGSNEIKDQLAILATEINSLSSAINQTLDINTQIKSDLSEYQITTNQELSILKQGKDNIGNGIFVIWGVFVFLVPTFLILFIVRKNHFRLVDEFISQVEKYRNLLAVKKALEIELQEANARVNLFKTELEKAGIKIHPSFKK